MLQSLGLDELAHEIYRLALARPGCRLDDLIRDANAPETAVRRSVDRLLELALLRKASGTLVPARPPLALRTVLERQQKELLRRQEEFVHIKAAVDRLSEEYEDAHARGTHAGWERLDTPAELHARMEHLSGRTTGECVSLLPTTANSAEALRARRPMDQHMLERGVTVWNVYLESVYNDRAGLAYARWVAQNGGRVGTAPTLPLWLVIYDRTTALLPADPEEVGAGAVQVSGAGYIAGLIALFEQLCGSMTPLDAPGTCNGDQPTPVERELLRLMGQGLTDEAVCKKLGVGLRTARRMIADITERLGARSRFEAGAKAVERGWLRPCACGGDQPIRTREPKGLATASSESLTIGALAREASG
ncbi:helix-turn-helix transcriptional regulator [Streptomyces sp. RB110-1]|uniref:helix-turn-helix transcriptional regulator n=1 Tax=unclassified Streptomyces TaxID=2593676 RepID=UPI0019007A92|nr:MULTISPECIES: helix-turn-helix transcriptional regulator [unclassified Streptomyces]MBK0372961.1 helix-turn-helix transcriptional regulator [Streptomyces sp. RB110-1]MBK0390671.1 helix-turn-helix transcriptional regulator [Streptomyces sp. RB110-2]